MNKRVSSSVNDRTIQRSLILFWGVFALDALTVLLASEDRISVPVVYHAAWITFSLFALLAWANRGAAAPELAPTDRFLVFAFLFLTLVAIITGPLMAQGSNYLAKEAVRQVVPFLGFALVFSPLASLSGLRRVFRAAAWQGPVILIVVIVVTYRYPLYISKDVTRDYSGPHFAATQLSASCGGLLVGSTPGFPYPVLRLFGYAAPVMIGLVSQTKAIIIVFLALNALLAVPVLAAQGARISAEYWKRLCVIIIVGVGLLTALSYVLLKVAQSDSPAGLYLKESYSRITGGNLEAGTTDFTKISGQEEDLRIAESITILENLTLAELLLGDGFGNQIYSKTFGFNANFAHIGPTAMILKGGVLYTAIFMMLIVRSLWKGWLNRGEPVLGACFIIVADRLVLFMIHSEIDPGYGSALLWLAVGALLRCGPPQRRTLTPRRS